MTELYQTISINASYLAFIIAVLAAGALILGQINKRKWLDISGLALASITFIAMSTSLVTRSLGTGHLPLNSVYEFLLSFSWMLSLCVLFLVLKLHLPTVAAIVDIVAAALLMVSFKLDNGVRPLMPALRSSWRPVHVVTAIIAYGAFASAFAMGIYFLVKYPKSKLATLEGEPLRQSERLEQITYNTIIGGFIFLTLLIITGAFWAEEAWGTWWSWDPKETWGLITWLIYAAYLHLRTKPNGRGRRGSWLAVLGFSCVLFTLLGVSYLMPGMHSYG